jgi:hypothetical protein
MTLQFRGGREMANKTPCAELLYCVNCCLKIRSSVEEHCAMGSEE